MNKWAVVRDYNVSTMSELVLVFHNNIFTTSDVVIVVTEMK